MIKESVPIAEYEALRPTTGTAGLRTQLAGQPTTVSALAAGTGGIGRGRLVERDTK